mgnify:CR=1 FL=1
MNKEESPPGQEHQTGLVTQPSHALARIDPRALENTKADLQLLGRFVRDVLEPDIDYGTIPGIKVPGLWEPGADKLISAYNCFSRPVVVKHEMDEASGFILYIMRAEAVGRYSGEVVADGIGEASTTERKYRCRWVAAPQDYGLDPERDGLRKRTDKRTGEITYRIPNPDWGDLVHTLAQMAYKRAKVDAAQSLPGVSSALRRLFHPPAHRAPGGPAPQPTTSPAGEPASSERVDPGGWTAFWGEMKALGLSSEEVHRVLGVNSLVKDWIEKGRTLASAREIIMNKEAANNEATR